jgi:hypothetical protein
MHSTPNPKQTDPRDFLMIAPEDKELSNLAHDAMCYSSAQTRMGSDFSAGPPIPPVDMTFCPADVNNVQVPGDRPSIGRRAVRAFTGFLLTACIGGAGVAWQFYGDAAKRIVARWAPQLVLTSSPATKAAPPHPASLAQPAPEGVAPTAATLSPESAQLLQSMARDLASAGQEIEQLKASIEQLKASEEQMSRDVAKASERNLRPKISASPPRSAAAPARKPMPPFPPPQAAAPSVPRQPESQPQATAQPQGEPQSSSVPRQPMPVR